MRLTIEPPEPQPLQAIWLKLTRSQEHLNAFHAESEAYKLERRGDHVAELTDDTLTITPVTSTPPPIRLSLIVGDCLTNCHAALDYAMRSIAVRHFSPAFDVDLPDDRRQASFKTRLREVAEQIKHFEARGVGAAVLEMVRSLDSAGKPPLLLLKTLVNTDKHHVLLLTAPVVTAARVVTFVNESRMGLVQGSSIAEGVRLRLGERDIERIRSGDARFQVEADREIRWNDPSLPVDPVGQTLQQIIDESVKVVRILERALGRPIP